MEQLQLNNQLTMASLEYMVRQKKASEHSYESLAAELESSPVMSLEGAKAMLAKIAEAGLTQSESSALIKVIAKQSGIGVGDLKEDLKTIEKEGGNEYRDVPFELATSIFENSLNQGELLIYAYDTFWGYNGKHFEIGSDENVKNVLLPMVQVPLLQAMIPINGGLKNVFSLLKTLCAKQGDPMRFSEPKPPIINCQNGELWIAKNGTVELKQHCPSSRLTSVLKIEYDPEATCPEFHKALLRMFSDYANPEDMVRHIYEFIGYVIQPDRFIPSIFLLKGPGRDGKTQLMELFTHLLCPSAIYARSLKEIAQNNFAMGDLLGKLLLCDDDMDTNFLLPDGLLKKISERKLLTGEKKFKDSQEFISTIVPVMLSNHYPRTADISFGMKRRINVIPCNQKFSDAEVKDSPFPYIFENELAGILNAALAGLQRLRERGHFNAPAECEMAAKEWFAVANPIVGFVDDSIVEAPGKCVTLQQFMENLSAWCRSHNISYSPSHQHVRDSLQSRNYDLKQKNHQWVIMDVGFSENVPETTEEAVNKFFEG